MADARSSTASPVAELFLALLVVATAAGWVLAPQVVRHQAGVEPLLFETVPVTAAEPAGGHAFLAVTPPRLQGSPWASARLDEVHEDGRPLPQAPPRAVRQDGDGRYAVATRGDLLFAPTRDPQAPARRQPPPTPSRYTVRRPAEVSGPVLRGALVLFGVMNVVAAVALMRGLRRSAVLRGLSTYAPLAIVAWLAAELAIEETLPWTGSDLLGQKMEQLREDIDTYDAVFLGSSRVFRQLDPQVFDSVFAAAGVPMRSFNLGEADMRMPEALFLLRWLLDADPDRLRLLVVDVEEHPLFIREENLTSLRIVRWHDPQNYAAMLGEIRRTSPTRAVALYRAGRHAEPFLFHATHLGRGLQLLTERLEPPPPMVPRRYRGFYAGDEEMATLARRDWLEFDKIARKLHDDLDRWNRDVARLTQSAPAGALTDPFEIELFTELQRLAARHGVSTVFVIDARPVETPNLIWAAENGVVETLLRFDDPQRYPELYDPSRRFDRHHVNKEGSRLFTSELARRILRALEWDAVPATPTSGAGEAGEPRGGEAPTS